MAAKKSLQEETMPALPVVMRLLDKGASAAERARLVRVTEENGSYRLGLEFAQNDTPANDNVAA